MLPRLRDESVARFARLNSAIADYLKYRQERLDAIPSRSSRPPFRTPWCG